MANDIEKPQSLKDTDSSLPASEVETRARGYGMGSRSLKRSPSIFTGMTAKDGVASRGYVAHVKPVEEVKGVGDDLHVSCFAKGDGKPSPYITFKIGIGRSRLERNPGIRNSKLEDQNPLAKRRRKESNST
ncbi:MAG TPA: hypothetical protein VKV95_02965 [Terriglobia bacterium]|nr:hypothetical protein [Terriglobia bacterium]